jgi:hypothetical protein
LGDGRSRPHAHPPLDLANSTRWVVPPVNKAAQRRSPAFPGGGIIRSHCRERTGVRRSSAPANFGTWPVALFGHHPRSAKHGSGAWTTGCFGAHAPLRPPPQRLKLGRPILPFASLSIRAVAHRTPQGRRDPRSPRKARQNPYPHGWPRRAPRSGSPVRGACSRGVGKGGRWWAPRGGAAGAGAEWAGSGLPLPQAKARFTIARPVILFGSDPYCRGSGPFVLRGGGGSRKSAVALPSVHTPQKNLASVSRIRGHVACARPKSGFDGGVIGSKLLRRWLAPSKKFTGVSRLRLTLCFPRNGHVAYARRYPGLYNVRD